MLHYLLKCLYMLLYINILHIDKTQSNHYAAGRRGASFVPRKAAAAQAAARRLHNIIIYIQYYFLSFCAYLGTEEEK